VSFLLNIYGDKQNVAAINKEGENFKIYEVSKSPKFYMMLKQGLRIKWKLI
jgi:hypothetical protein